MTTDKTIDKFLDTLTEMEFDEQAEAIAGMDEAELYKDKTTPVDIIQFVEDTQFLGDIIKVEPRVLELLHLIELPGVREAFVQIGKGSGKSLVGAIVPVYGAYKLLKMRRPHQFFGLAPTTIIATINVATSRKQAKDIIFAQIKGFIEEAPWFKENNKFDVLTEEVIFPEGKVTCYCGHSNSTAFLGFATFRAVLDEANFMVNNTNRIVAEDLFAALKGSCKTRFPGEYKILSISSAATPGAWLHQEVLNIQREGKEVILTEHGIQPGSQKQRKVDKEQTGVEVIDFDDELFDGGTQ